MAYETPITIEKGIMYYHPSKENLFGTLIK